MPTLTVAQLRSAPNDSERLQLIFAHLNEALPPSAYEDPDELLAGLQRLPIGLRSMAATFQLDVSMALDDLGWHFANWLDHGYSQETSSGLKELGAREVAELFDKAYAIASRYWDEIARRCDSDSDDFVEWYPRSRLKAELDPLNERLWQILGREETSGEEQGIFRYWVAYARKHPERVAST